MTKQEFESMSKSDVEAYLEQTRGLASIVLQEKEGESEPKYVIGTDLKDQIVMFTTTAPSGIIGGLSKTLAMRLAEELIIHAKELND